MNLSDIEELEIFLAFICNIHGLRFGNYYGLDQSYDLKRIREDILKGKAVK